LKQKASAIIWQNELLASKNVTKKFSLLYISIKDALYSSLSFIYCLFLTMKYLASYLLLVAGGKTAPTADDVKALMASVGVEAEEERLTSLISALEGKNVDEVSF